jgi:Caspase domain
MTKSSEMQEFGPIRDRWAFLVGIQKYSGLEWRNPPLKHCKDDVLALEKLLKEKFGYAGVICLYDDHPKTEREPTLENVKTQLGLLCSSLDQNDFLFVHFSCHGDQLDKAQPFLAMKDTRRGNSQKPGLLVSQIEETIRNNDVKRSFVSLDACYVGIPMGGRGATDDPIFLYHVYDMAEGFARISASTASQQAHESAELGHGIYTYYLLEALAGKAVTNERSFVTVGDIERYTRAKVKTWWLDKGYSRVQDPTNEDHGMGASNMKVVDWTGGVMPAIAPSVSSIPSATTPEQSRGVLESSDSSSFYRNQLKRKQADLEAVELDLEACVGTELERKLIIRAEQILKEIENLKKKL